MKKQKFTLIEVLVVIAIIGILASLILPALGKARKKSQMSVCKSNMKQLHVASMMYTDDNNDYFPFDIVDMSWNDHLAGYDGRNVDYSDLNTNTPLSASQYSEGVYACPSDNVERAADVLTLSYSPVQLTIHGGSFINTGQRGITGIHWGSSAPVSAKISEINQTSGTISTFEYMAANNSVGAGGRHPSKYGGGGFSVVLPGTFFGSLDNIPHEESGKSNFLFVDGHVASHTPLATLVISGGGVGSAGDTTGTMWDAHK
ncbi:hypothetical protein LNTAR_22100 [Lentisphaera araneosa HTCC2155]|uniref:Uncharacterized protein n=1 Tax=Lentisphaera araneosa HTCC2155 TaxID=313628 RepID=A6DSN1_9BACT|nr:type II secretion system protein [Lentisphaera araneosa]EDM25384.1 hypothetical protein LNTAR_22100 [Lentisphaera araneosa HTCC2155]